MTRQDLLHYRDCARSLNSDCLCHISAEDLAELAEIALRALEPARVICPSPRQDCEGCPHGIEHDHGDCEALDGCPACVEVKP